MNTPKKNDLFDDKSEIKKIISDVSCCIYDIIAVLGSANYKEFQNHLFDKFNEIEMILDSDISKIDKLKKIDSILRLTSNNNLYFVIEIIGFNLKDINFAIRIWFNWKIFDRSELAFFKWEIQYYKNHNSIYYLLDNIKDLKIADNEFSSKITKLLIWLF